MQEEKKKQEDKRADAGANDQTQIVDAGLVAPVSAAAGASGDAQFVPSPPRGQAEDGKPRKKTFGENLFDISIYGGIGWIANEFLSGAIFDRAAYKGQWFSKPYEAGVNGMHKLFGKAEQAHPEKWLSKIKRPFDIFVLTLGGNLLVLPMKIAEDNKGDLVRTANYGIGGKKGDPELERAHDEMDHAPKQSWGTLAQSRLVTLAGAIGIDYAMGADNAWSTKLFKSEGGKKWASLNNINTSVFRKIAKFAEEHWGYDKGATERIELAEKHSPFDIISQKTLDNLPQSSELRKIEGLESEGKIANFGKSYGFIFLLSGVLAGIFYINSRIFAHNRDKSDQHMDEHRAAGTSHIGFDNAGLPARTDQLDGAQQQDKPETKISNVHMLDRVQNTHHEAVGI